MKCPLTPLDPGHYQYQPPLKPVHSILEMIRNRPRPTHDENGFWILDSAQAMYNRLFCRRKKRVVRRKRTAIYAIFDHRMYPIRSVKTKKEAMKLLKRDSLEYKLFHRKMKPNFDNEIFEFNPVQAGAMVVRIPAKGKVRNSLIEIDSERYTSPTDLEYPKFRKAVKRCSGCKIDTDVNATYCPCAMINNLKESTPKWQLWSDHQIKMYLNRLEKHGNKTVNIRIGIEDLLD